MVRRLLLLLAPAVLLTGTLTGSLTAPAAEATGTSGAITAATAATASSLSTSQFEARLVSLTNARRTRIGCADLRVSSALVYAARAHTLRMVQTGSFSHQVPAESGLATRIVRAGYVRWSLLAENIAWGQRLSPARIFDLWMHSAPHRANIQNCRLRNIGYGVRYQGGSIWVTGDFGRH
jgi:uncharacterized protein YkwD